MSIVAVVSMKGGVGKTSLTANLACGVASILGVGRVCVVDLDPQNALHLHFGVDDTHAPGVCVQSLEAADWGDTGLQSEYGVACLPYGAVSEAERKAFEALLTEQPDWIGSHIRSAGLDDDAVVFIDTPPGPSVYLKQAFACADVVLVVVLADAGSYATLPAMESWLADAAVKRPELKCLYVINQVDRGEILNHDVTDLLNQQLKGKVSGIGIHSDESVREALAFQQPVMAYDPHGQASHDLARLANQLIEILSQ